MDLILDWAAAATAGVARAGGKGSHLGRLFELGIPVPPGFVVDAGVSAGRERGGLSALLVASLAEALRSRGWNDVPLAVRSSASSEDSTRASFAGIYKTCLNVRGLVGLIDAVQEVLDSYWKPAAVAYRECMGLSNESSGMAVIVMPMLPAVASGVAFTCDPVGGREDQIVIHANWGLGDSLVGGGVEGDEYRLQMDYPGKTFRWSVKFAAQRPE